MRRNYSFILGSILICIILVIIFWGPHLPFVDNELKQNGMWWTSSGEILVPPFPPMEDFLLGSDRMGVDVYSRIMLGAKETFIIVLCIVFLRYIIAIPLGVLGYYFKFVNYFLNGLNQLLSYMPPIFFIGLILGIPFIVFSEIRSIWIIIVIALVEVGRVADSILQTMIDISKKAYFEAGVSTGCSKQTLFMKYFLPPLMPHIIVQFTNDIGRSLFILAQLGIVGVYITQEFISQLGGAYQAFNTSNAWPTIFSSITFDIFRAWWIPVSAACAIGISLIALNLFVSGLQTYFEKKYRKFSL